MGFQHCSDTFLANLALRLRPRSFLAGTWILNMGDATTDLYFVDSGKCPVIAYPDEESLVLATIQRGNYFGEVGLLFDVPRTASVFAAEHTDVFTLKRASVSTHMSKRFSNGSRIRAMSTSTACSVAVLNLRPTLSSFERCRFSSHFPHPSWSSFPKVWGRSRSSRASGSSRRVLWPSRCTLSTRAPLL